MSAPTVGVPNGGDNIFCGNEQQTDLPVTDRATDRVFPLRYLQIAIYYLTNLGQTLRVELCRKVIIEDM